MKLIIVIHLKLQNTVFNSKLQINFLITETQTYVLLEDVIFVLGNLFSFVNLKMFIPKNYTTLI